MIAFSRKTAWCLVVFGLFCNAIVHAQGKSELNDGGPSIAALTAEVRQLRIAVEELSRNQTQTQALGVYLSAQQSRIVQLATRLDAARKDLDATSAKSLRIANGLANIATELGRATDPQQRLGLEQAERELKTEQRTTAAEEQLARVRESELSQTLQVENGRWTDLISRLEELLKK